MLGGGYDSRPYKYQDKLYSRTSLPANYFTANRTLVSVDNTALPALRGDYAVPTLFDGNFDSISPSPGWKATESNQFIAGWSSTSNGNAPLTQSSLRTWSQIAGESSAFGSYLDKMGTATFGSNYALKLERGKSITHNSFVVPDWGALRFDLFAPSLTGGRVNFRLDAGDGSGGFSSWVNLTPATGTATTYLADTQRIGYGSTGFETFTFDVPDRFRGKTATLRFESSGPTVYLDNVFFKSQNLILGNPGEARKPENADNSANKYLLEKPQYAVSYSRDNQTPNWVSYQLNRTWTGGSRKDEFNLDPELPFQPGWYRVPGNAYNKDDSFGYARGHMAAALDIARTNKDAIAADLMTNMIPQNNSNNSGMWRVLETDLRKLVDDPTHNRNLYIITGNSGSISQITRIDKPGLNINVPESTWKIVLVSERTIESISDIENDTSALAFGVCAPNDASVKGVNWRIKQNSNYLYSVRDVEQNTNYNFFSNLSLGTQERLENRTRNNVWQDVNALFASLPSSPLLAGVDEVSSSSALDTNNTSVWHSGAANDVGFSGGKILSSQEIGISEISSTNTAAFKYSILQTGFAEISPTATTSTQVTASKVSPVKQSSIETGITQHGVTEISLPTIGSDEIASIKHSFMEISPEQFGSSEISSIHINSTQVGIIQNSSDETGTGQSSIRQIDASKFSLDQVSPSKGNSTEISLPSSITLQQLFSSHNFSLQNTSVPTWLEFLQGTTPFNLNIKIADLPTGQLAEANITGFDPTGHPNSGTLTLDTDANGLGWYIDPTPWDNTEYSQPLTDTAYRATADSLAYGHYDLLTTLLHETAHLQGIIAGYSNYDSHIR